MKKSDFIFETEVFPAKHLKGKDLTDENIDVLQNVGLPEWVAPHLYFGHFETQYLPSIDEWLWLDDWKNSSVKDELDIGDCKVIGSNEAPIFFKPNDSTVYTFEECGRKVVVINSNLKSLLHVLNAFAIMIEEVIKTTSDNICESRVVEKATLDKFKKEFKQYEKLPMSQTEFWQTEINSWRVV